jgi:ATP-dependent RNA helicase DeaD
LSRQLIERLGPEGAVEALVTVSYGEVLDPARYSPVTEFPEIAGHEAEVLRKGKRIRSGRFEDRRPGPYGGPAGRAGVSVHGAERPDQGGRSFGKASGTRVYVGLGRRHGASARDVAGLLMRAGGVAGHMVDAIEMKDYCAFATMPEEAARRAYAFSRNTPGDPAIKPASPGRKGGSKGDWDES